MPKVAWLALVVLSLVVLFFVASWLLARQRRRAKLRQLAGRPFQTRS